MVSVLAEVPLEWELVASDPGRAPAVIEEVLRFRSTATSVGRTAIEDLEIDGVKVAKGSRVMGYLWGANHDPAAFSAPERLDVDGNRANPQLAFGHGAHHCLGAALARAELQEALVALTSAVECPEILPGATFLPPLGINGPLSLPISVKARGRTRTG
jgi:cytochrome P450